MGSKHKETKKDIFIRMKSKVIKKEKHGENQEEQQILSWNTFFAKSERLRVGGQ